MEREWNRYVKDDGSDSPEFMFRVSHVGQIFKRYFTFSRTRMDRKKEVPLPIVKKLSVDSHRSNIEHTDQ